MTDLFGFPSAEVLVRADGSVDGNDAAARALAADPGVTDLLVITHGWNNDILGARDLFAQLARSLREVVDGGHGLPSGRTLGILGAIWPSRQFALPDQMQGVAAVGPTVTQRDLFDAIDGLRAVFPGEDARLDRAAALVPDLVEDVSARQEFADLVRGLVTPDVGDGTECPDALFTLPGDVVLAQLSVPVDTPTVDAGLGDFLGGILGGGLNLLNYTTFYAMKERSAVVGAAGLAPLLGAIARPGLRLHLAGHSFGARLAFGAHEGAACRHHGGEHGALAGRVLALGFAATGIWTHRVRSRGCSAPTSPTSG